LKFCCRWRVPFVAPAGQIGLVTGSGRHSGRRARKSVQFAHLWASPAGCTNPLQIEPNPAEMAFSEAKNPQNSSKYPLFFIQLCSLSAGARGTFPSRGFCTIFKLPVHPHPGIGTLPRDETSPLPLVFQPISMAYSTHSARATRQVIAVLKAESGSIVGEKTIPSHSADTTCRDSRNFVPLDSIDLLFVTATPSPSRG